MYEFTMPSLGAAMDEGTVVGWNVDVGDPVERGEIICEIETQKGIIDVEVWQSGVVEEILIPVGQKVPVGEPLALLRVGEEDAAPEDVETDAAPSERPTFEETPAGGVEMLDELAEDIEATPPPPAETSKAPAHVQRPREPAEKASETAKPSGTERQKVSPAARKRAAELGVDPATVRGTGPDGAVGLRDVEAAAASPEDAEGPTADAHRPRVSPLARRIADTEGVDLEAVEGTGEHGAITRRDVERAAGLRQPVEPLEAHERPEPGAQPDTEIRQSTRDAIGRAMEQSKREIPHYYLRETVDMQAAVDWLESTNAGRPAADRLLPAVLLLKACALACGEVPEMNGYYRDGEFEPSGPVHVGFAVALRGGGVITPAIHDVDHKDLDHLMTDLRDLVGRVRRRGVGNGRGGDGRLRASEMSDATITVTSLGEQGVESVYGIIYPPQVAILGFGKIVERPWAQDGMVGARQVMTATLSGDHRVTDGVTGARFLSAIAQLLQHPETL